MLAVWLAFQWVYDVYQVFMLWKLDIWEMGCGQASEATNPINRNRSKG